MRVSFALLALLFGLAFALLVPPQQGPDEQTHFVHAYFLSEGGLRFGRNFEGEQGVRLPREVASFRRRFDPERFRSTGPKTPPAELLERLAVGTASAERRFVGSYPSYSPLAYAPQVAGIVVGRAAGLTVAGTFYAGRVAALLFWIACLLVAIRILPLFRWVYWAIGLLPMSLFLAASYSADVVTSGMALLLVAAILRLAFAPEAVFDGRAAAALAALATAVAFTKLVYAPLVLLVLAIPAAKAASKGAYARLAAVVVAVPLLASLLSLALAPGLFHPMLHAPALSRMPRTPGVLLRQPLQFVADLLHTTWVERWSYVDMMIGRLGWLDANLPDLAVWICLLTLLGLAVIDHARGVVPSPVQRALGVSVAVAIYAAIQAMAWVRWTLLEMPIIVGFQGRYLIPLLPALLLALPVAPLAPGPRAWRWLHAVLVATTTAVLFTAILTILERYYGLHAALSTVGLQPLVEGGLLAAPPRSVP